jgi:hypothetical protein
MDEKQKPWSARHAALIELADKLATECELDLIVTGHNRGLFSYPNASECKSLIAFAKSNGATIETGIPNTSGYADTALKFPCGSLVTFSRKVSGRFVPDEE